jgi:hypothetical protein
LPAAEFKRLQHSQGLGRFFKSAKEEVKSESDLTVKEKRAQRQEESKRIEAVVDKSQLLSKLRKDTVEDM